MKMEKAASPLKRRLWKCGTTPAGKISLRCDVSVWGSWWTPHRYKYIYIFLPFVFSGLLTSHWSPGAIGKDGSLPRRTCRLETSSKHQGSSDAWQVNDSLNQWKLSIEKRFSHLAECDTTLSPLTLQSQPTRVMRTHWELFPWGHWWTIWSSNLGRGQSTSVQQVITLACVASWKTDGHGIKELIWIEPSLLRKAHQLLAQHLCF